MRRHPQEHSEFTWNPDEYKEAQERQPFRNKCTRETLLAFIAQHRAEHNRLPTMEECKKEFGGILSALVIGWALRDEGLI